MFTRKCPECKEEILYKYESTRNKAEVKKARCATCRNQRNLKPNCECETCGKQMYKRKSIKEIKTHLLFIWM